jgi:hypothetical protein
MMMRLAEGDRFLLTPLRGAPGCFLARTLTEGGLQRCWTIMLPQQVRKGPASYGLRSIWAG